MRRLAEKSCRITRIMKKLRPEKLVWGIHRSFVPGHHAPHMHHFLMKASTSTCVFVVCDMLHHCVSWVSLWWSVVVSCVSMRVVVCHDQENICECHSSKKNGVAFNVYRWSIVVVCEMFILCEGVWCYVICLRIWVCFYIMFVVSEQCHFILSTKSFHSAWQ